MSHEGHLISETSLWKWGFLASILVFHIEEYNIKKKKNQMEKFLHNVKWKTEFFHLIKQFYRGEPPPHGIEKCPNEVEIDQKNLKKIYVAL